MKYLFTIAFVIASTTWLHSQTEPREQTLKECIDYAIENNLTLKNQTLIQSILENNYQQAKYDRLPDVNASSNLGINFGQSFDLQANKFISERATNFNIGAMANVDLFNGFYKYHSINKRLLETHSGAFQSEIIQNRIILDVLNAYLQILFNKEQSEIVNKQLETTNLQIDRAEKLINSGTITKGDLLSLLSQKAEEESQLIAYKNMVRMSELGLIQLMNYTETTIEIVKPNINETIITTTLPEEIEALYGEALAFLPELKLTENQLQTSHQVLKLSKSGYYPSLRMNAGFSTQLKDRKYFDLGMTLSIPIFSKFRNRTNVQNAKIEILQSENDILKTKQDIYKIIQSVHNDVLASRENYKSRQQLVTANEESFRFAEQRFNAGAINAIDYNLEKNKLTSAISKLLQSKYDLLIKLKVLDFYRGQDIEL
ncbi:MAG: TolC family protein [Salinivirgaceae bacterium]|nr:TolC family protein [Salinivirgaceae bacterium]